MMPPSAQLTLFVHSMLKTLLGASKVIVWNSVVRRADVAPPAEFKQRQQLSLEKAAAPSSSASATAGSAHVDQDEVRLRFAPSVVNDADRLLSFLLAPSVSFSSGYPIPIPPS